MTSILALVQPLMPSMMFKSASASPTAFAVLRYPVACSYVALTECMRTVGLPLTGWAWLCMTPKIILTLTFSLPLVIGLHRMFAFDWRSPFQHLASLVAYHTNLCKFDADLIRSTFNGTPLVHQKPTDGHTHGVSAAHRSTATLTVERIANAMGMHAYFYQRSRCDERAGRDGLRTWWWAKDFTTEPVYTLPGSSSLVVHIDTDYHVDMPSMLIENFQPTVLYTFQPDHAACVRSDYSYTFDAQSNVHYSVHGGGQFSHRVWNYGLDHFTVVKRFLGLPLDVATYLVDKRRVSEDHYLILLTPIARWSGPSALLSYFFSSKVLQPLRVAAGEFLRLVLVSPDCHQISTARVMTHAHATVPVEVDDTIGNLIRVSKNELTMPSVESALGPHPDDKDEVVTRRQQAAILTAYHRTLCTTPPDVVFPVADSVHRYQYGKYDSEAKPSMVAFMSPMLHESYAPDRTVGNERRAVQSRILDPKSTITEVTPFLHKCMQEFAERLIPVPHLLHPVDYETVTEHQPRPTQRAILTLSETLLADGLRICKSFLKTESVAKPADPRLISTINPVDKRTYSGYMYSFVTLLKHMPWYAFSRPPSGIASAVAVACSDANTVAKTDFSRFDGSLSVVLRELERVCLLRAFAPAYHSELAEVHGAQFNMRGVTTQGEKYDTGAARLSGSPETANFNSLDNAFSSYVAYRKTICEGRYLTPDEAWALLLRCLFGGDDGLVRNMDPKVYVSACTSLGLIPKIELVRRGEFGVMFLARVYSPDVWFGDLNSCCDVLRQLSKLHVSRHLPPKVTAEDKLVAKCRGYIMSDPNTPILGPFCHKVLALSAKVVLTPDVEQIAPYLAKFDAEVQYLNKPARWMDDYVSSLGLDMPRFERWLTGVHTLHGLLSPPLLREPKPFDKVTETVVVDKQTHYGKEQKALPARTKRSLTVGPIQPLIAPRPSAKKSQRASSFARAKGNMRKTAAEAAGP
jgi:hypothetical protein